MHGVEMRDTGVIVEGLGVPPPGKWYRQWRPALGSAEDRPACVSRVRQFVISRSTARA